MHGKGTAAPDTNGTDGKFTGQTEDEVPGLYWYKSRYYDPGLGFVQPGTIVPAPKNPQSLNRYSYGLNNPLRYSDPSGHNPDPGDISPSVMASNGVESGGSGNSGGYDTTYPEGDPGGPDSGSANQPAAEDPRADNREEGSGSETTPEPEPRPTPTPTASPVGTPTSTSPRVSATPTRTPIPSRRHGVEGWNS